MWRGGDEVTQAFLPVVWQGYWSGGDRQECLSHFWGVVVTDRNVYLTRRFFSGHKKAASIHDAAFER
jgi:hypothetical protein